jgi:hypothetical protein
MINSAENWLGFCMKLVIGLDGCDSVARLSIASSDVGVSIRPTLFEI